jgi:hypothetical protein
MQIACSHAKISCAVVFFFFFFAAVASAQNTIHVPADVPNIQEAIFAANNGDTILVSPGTYSGFSYQGKNVIVQSTDGPAVTVLDGGGFSTLVSFINGESQQAALRGFTITHGSAFQEGGGIEIMNSSPIIEGNIITANAACGGGGISANGSSAIIRNNTISNNSTSACSPPSGGAGIKIVGPGNVQLLNNTITGNQLIGGGNGGGIDIDVGASPLVSGNLIQNNSALGFGGGVAVGSSGLLVNNVITGNTAGQGGGIYSLLNQAQPSFINNTVAGNSAGQGTQLYVDGFDANVEIANNLWIDLTGTGAVFCGSSSGQVPAFDHNDVFSSSPGGGQAAPYGGACADVTGISGNIQADPQFVDPASGNYHLQSSSPALDSGNNLAANLPSTDLEGNLRVAVSNTLTCVGIVDMGAYELVAPSTGTGFLSPSSFDFGTDFIGTPSFQEQFTFFASQGCVQAAVQIHGDFQQTNNCTALQSGNACTIQVTFNPTAPGLRTGSLQLNLGPGIAPVAAGLSGRGLNALTSFPSSLDFGGQPVPSSGSGVSQFLTVQSQSSVPLQVTGISITGDFSQTNTCSQSFGFSCSVGVTFNPTAVGLRTGTLTITSNLGVLTIPLSGTGLAPIASISPSSLVFASQTIGSASQSQVVTLTNAGPTDLLINGFNASPDFFVQPVTCFGFLSTGASCTFSVTFSPLAIGDRSGTLEVDTNGGNVTVALVGTGTPPIASLSPQLLAFPAAPIGSVGATQTVTVTNISGGFLQITSLGATNNFLASSTCPLSLNPNDTCSINVSFVPNTFGPYKGFLTLATNFGTVTAVLSADDGHHTFHVPADFPSIMSAISAAQNGDTILVSPGTYTEQINFQGRAITVASTSGPAVTILDGQNFLNPVAMFNNEPPQAVLRGFTITRAGNVAIQLSGASPTIEDNIITNSTACGGGIGVELFSSAAIIRHNTISNNASQCGFDAGGGVIQVFGTNFQGRAQILNNTITGNRNSSLAGGAISVTQNGSALIQGNTIQNNSTTGNGGGIYVSNGSTADIVNNLITGNSASIGGGVYETVDFFGQSPLFLNNTIADNSSGSAGTAVFIDGADGNIIFWNNLLIDSAGLPAVGCGSTGGQVPAFFSNDVVSLVPSAPAFGGVCQDSSETANLKLDPQFVSRANANYHLKASSPAIDAGNRTVTGIPSQDLDGNSRIGPGNAQTCSSLIDLGAFEFQLTSSGSVFLPSTFDLGTAPITGSNTSFLNVSASGCVQLSSLKTTGDFTQSPNSCDGALSSSFSCSVLVTFTPTDVGLRKGSLKFDFGTSSPAQTVALTGTGFLAGMGTSPASLNFGSQAVQTSSAAQTITILPNFFGNSFSSPVVNGIWIGGDFSQTNTCTAPNPAGPNCTFSITFFPTATGLRTGLLVVSTNQGIATVPLSGTGAAAATATLTPTSLVFPAQFLNTSSFSQTLTLKNTGGLTITPGPTTITGDFAVNISGHTLGCHAPLGPGATCTYLVTFLPTAIGTRTGLFTVQTEAGPLSASLSGTGVAPLPSVSPQSLTFANQILNTTSAAQTVALSNLGNLALTITGISATGDFAQTNNCPTSLAPGLRCTINVTFTPKTLGSQIQALNISTTAGLLSGRLSGAGMNAAATVAPTALSFGSELLNTNARARTVTLIAGINPLQITSITASGDFAQTNACGPSLAPGASCAIQVTFTPTMQGPDSGSLNIVSNEGTLSAPLSGVGILRAANAIYIPVDQPTIQAAITNTGAPTIYVLPGTYQENLNFEGRATTVTSTDGPSATTIDGKSLGPVVTFSRGEGPASILSGFTLTNGNSLVGGGIFISSASPTIQNNVITFNQGCGGVGINLNFGSPIIQNNTVSHNFSSACSGGNGGGISVGGAGTPQILNNIITDNTIPDGGDGGGISINASSPTVIGNVIQRNSVFNDGGGISIINASNANIIQNLITDNHATGRGGGIYWDVPSGSRGPLVVNNTIAANTAVDGSAIFSDGFAANVQVFNNVLAGNAGIPALECSGTLGSPVLTSNDAFSSGAAGYAGTCSTASGTNGNVSVDPQFIDVAGKNYRLQATSAAIDAGNNAAPNLPPLDLDGNARIAFGNSTTCSNTVDMGAYEFVLTTVPSATLTPASLDFGIQPVGTTSAGQAFRLTATQGCLSPGTISTSGDFSQTNNCSSALATGSACTVQVSFAPTASGSRTGSLSVSANGALLSSSLTGQGGFAAASLSPASLSFGNQLIRTTSAAQTVTLTNSGNLSLQISSISLSGPFTQNNTCPASLAPGTACVISVAFAPAVAGAASGALTVNSNGSSAPNSVPVAGTGTAPIAVLTQSLSYAAQIVQTTSSQTATLTNNGTAVLNISSVTANGDFSASNSCPAALAPGVSCSIQVSFVPTAAGARTGSLIVTDDDPSGGQQSTALAGAGLDYSISASPASVSVKAGQTALYTTTVTGLGGNFSSAITLTCGGLPTGANCSFSPSSLVPGPGSASSTFSLAASSGQHGTKKTPAGTYTVNVTGAEGQLTHSVSVKLVVQ